MLPEAQHFAGQSTSSPLAGGTLWRCQTCRFVFRDPLLPDGEYERLYARGSLNLWDSESAPREDFRLIRKLIAGYGGASAKVLDVGCYTGQLLKSLPDSFQLYGIEPNRLAAMVAADRGITLISSAQECANQLRQTFDVILLCDVIEHVAKPKDFLQTLGKSLKPGGWLVVSTGNSDSWLWRLTKARFWYCHFPEHISFVGTHWLSTVPQTIQLKPRQLVFFNYRGNGINVLKLGAALIYWLSPAFYKIIRRVTSRTRIDKPTPGMGATKDHVICVLEAY